MAHILLLATAEIKARVHRASDNARATVRDKQSRPAFGAGLLIGTRRA
jgi:hypothetical protein